MAAARRGAPTGASWRVVAFVAALGPALLKDGPADATPLGDLVVQREDGSRSLAEVLDGRPHVVHLWATWCAPCLTELPRLARFLDANPDLASRLVLLSVDSAPMERIGAFLSDRLGLTGLSSLKVVRGNAGAAFGVSRYPSTVFVDGARRVATVHGGAMDRQDDATREEIARHVAR